MFSANAAGLNKKVHSLKYQVKECNAAVFTVQETNFKKKGRFKFEEFEIFEAIRQNKEKGGCMLGIHMSLEPVLIEEYSEKFELIVTEVKIGTKEIRNMTGYGPQENWTDEDKMPFYVALEEEIVKAQMESKSIIMELDANCKLGSEYVPNDPKPMSSNGRIMAGIIDRHALCVANGISGKVKGTITRKRSTKDNIEESVIDFVIVSSDMVTHIESVHIDEEKIKVLTSITHTKNGVVKKESDHNSIETKFNIKWEKKEIPQRQEIFNFKDKEGQKKFHEMTDNSTKLSSVFDTKDNIEVQSKRFLKELNKILHQCFKKIRVTESTNKEVDRLFEKRKFLKKKEDRNSKKELNKVEEKLADKMAEDMYKIVKEEVELVKCEDGGFNSGHLWRLKNKLRPKTNNTPTAIQNQNGILVTTSQEIKKCNNEPL